MGMKSIRQCLDYLADHERQDYVDWCRDEGIDPTLLEQNQELHIFATAVVALYEGTPELEKVRGELK